MAKAIVFVTGSFRSGGFERRLKHLIELIVQKEPQLKILLFYQNKKGINLPNKENLNLKYWPSHFFTKLKADKLESFLFYKYLKFLTFKKNVNIFVGHQSILNLLTRNKYISKDRSIDIIANVVNNLAYSPYEVITKHSLKKCSKVIFNSFKNRLALKKELKLDNDYYIPNNYNIESIKNKINELQFNNFNIVSCGSFNYQKNFISLLETAKILSNQDKSITFTIFGDGPEKKTLLKLIEKNDLTNFSIISNKDFKNYVWQFDIFVLPSIYEGYPNALLEAQMSGLPCVSFDINYGPNEIIKDKITGILIKKHHPKAMANGIIKLKQNHRLYKYNTKKYASDLLEKHSLKNTIIPLINILKK